MPADVPADTPPKNTDSEQPVLHCLPPKRGLVLSLMQYRHKRPLWEVLFGSKGLTNTGSPDRHSLPVGAFSSS